MGTFVTAKMAEFTSWYWTRPIFLKKLQSHDLEGYHERKFETTQLRSKILKN